MQGERTLVSYLLDILTASGKPTENVQQNILSQD